MKHNGPWIIKSSRQVYKNPWIDVQEDQVIRPDGTPGIFATIQMKHGVSVLAMDGQGKVYLTEEFRYVLGTKSMEVVSGGVEPQKLPVEAGKRELREELGIEAEEWIDLGYVNPFTSVVHSPGYLFLARKLRFTAQQREGTEIIRVLKMPFYKAVELVMESHENAGKRLTPR